MKMEETIMGLSLFHALNITLNKSKETFTITFLYQLC